MAYRRKTAQLEIHAGMALKALQFPGLRAAAAVRQTPQVEVYCDCLRLDRGGGVDRNWRRLLSR
jgi:hypothetical protein